MLKSFISIFFLQAVFLNALAQQKEIDSIEKTLALLHDSARIDCLLTISFEYGHAGNDSDHLFWYVNSDSAVAYALKALKESKELKYPKGMANAFENLGEMAALQNYEEGENYFRQAILLYNQINDLKSLSWSDLWLGYYLMYECKFDEARLFYQKALCYYLQQNEDRQARTYGLLGNSYILQGYYTKALTYELKEVSLLQKQIKYQNDPINVAVRLAQLNKAAGDTLTALEFYRQSEGYAKKYNPEEYYEIEANINFLHRNYDSALYYNLLIDSSASNSDIGEIYMLRKDYSKALPYFLNNLSNAKPMHNTYLLNSMLDNIAKDYVYQEKFDSSLKYAFQLLSIASAVHARQFIRDGDWLIWKIYSQQKKTDSAYKYRLQYDIMNDSISQDELTRNLAVVKMKFDDEQKQSQIDLLKKNNQINQQEIKNESLQKNIFITGLVVAALIGLVLFRSITLKRKNEKLESQRTQTDLQHKATDLEMQALRSQMNPHFIFNCLSSINSFILKNKTEEASKYLTKFSRLIRMVLNNSKQSFISLEEELETLKLYLDMEKLRFKDAFEYTFNLPANLETENVFVPPLLLQPFAENAIWHGLMHKQQKGFVSFDFTIEKKFLTCTITDDGIGREQSALLKSKSLEKQKSMGLKITTERLNLLNNDSNKQTVFTIEDLQDGEKVLGTRVHLKIFYKTLNEV